MKTKFFTNLFNRPGVVRAVLQTPLLLINSMSPPFPPNLQTIITPKPLDLGTWDFYTMFTTPCVPHDTCHMSGVTCQVSVVRCHMSGVTSNSQTVRAIELKFWEKVQLLTPVTCHMSHVMCHVSHEAALKKLKTSFIHSFKPALNQL